MEIEKEIQAHTNDVTIKLSEKIALLGATEKDFPRLSQKTLALINKAVIIGKLSISRFKYGKCKNLLETYSHDSKIRSLWK